MKTITIPGIRPWEALSAPASPSQSVNFNMADWFSLAVGNGNPTSGGTATATTTGDKTPG